MNHKKQCKITMHVACIYHGTINAYHGFHVKIEKKPNNQPTNQPTIFQMCRMQGCADSGF